jgi:hypothetical protein
MMSLIVESILAILILMVFVIIALALILPFIPIGIVGWLVYGAVELVKRVIHKKEPRKNWIERMIEEEKEKWQKSKQE